jgi:hypothetical protein
MLLLLLLPLPPPPILRGSIIVIITLYHQHGRFGGHFGVHEEALEFENAVRIRFTIYVSRNSDCELSFCSN